MPKSEKPSAKEVAISTLIPLADGSDYEPEASFIEELDAIYAGVGNELQKMRLWCLANPVRRKTRRGVKRFMFNWIVKACKPKVKVVESVRMRGVMLATPPIESLEVRRLHLKELKCALRKRQPGEDEPEAA